MNSIELDSKGGNQKTSGAIEYEREDVVVDFAKALTNESSGFPTTLWWLLVEGKSFLSLFVV